jgi:hypothetical protein
MSLMFIIPLDEHPGDNFIQAYWHILSDPAHFMVEVTLTIFLDVLLLGMAWPVVKNYVNSRLQRQHDELDAEHGIEHHDDHVHHHQADPDCEPGSEREPETLRS